MYTTPEVIVHIVYAVLTEQHAICPKVDVPFGIIIYNNNAMIVVKMNLECVCTHTMQCKLHHVPIHSVYVIKFNMNCLPM